MTEEEYNKAAALVVRLRKELEHTNQHLVAHIDALTKSNAQCAEYLRQNEQLRAELATARVSAASLERIQATAAKWGASGQEDAGHFIERTATDLEFMRLAKDEMQNKLAETTKDLAYSRLAVDTMCARDKRFKETGARCGAKDGEDIGDFIERSYADRNKMHSQLVEVRAALAVTTEQRDSLQRTLDEWDRADTKPHALIDPPTVPDDLEFREGIPTPAMLAICSWWEVQGRGDVICFKNKGQRPVVWRSLRGDASWQYDDCPQPLKPSKRTWKQLDLLLATAPDDVADHVVPPVLPLCNVCHECGSELANCSQGTNHHDCPRPLCPRTCTGRHGGGFSPYSGPCKSATPVRHE